MPSPVSLSEWLRHAREVFAVAYPEYSGPIRVVLVGKGGRKQTHCLPAVESKTTPIANLKEIEVDILEAVGRQTLPAREIAEKAGYKLNSHFRQTLSSLKKRGILTLGMDGYHRADLTS